jgi:hypothetical protein
MRTIKNIAFGVLFILSISISAQSNEPKYKIVGNEIVKVETAKAKPSKTNLTHTVKGIVFQVYKSKKGVFYIIRTSKKTNNEYKQYLKINKQ